MWCGSCRALIPRARNVVGLRARGDQAVSSWDEDPTKKGLPADKRFSAESLLKAMASTKNQVLDAHRYLNLARWSKAGLVEWSRKASRDADILGQKYIPERHQVLGSDLAAAHFIVFRGGMVRLNSSPRGHWIRLKPGSTECPPDLPKRYVKDIYITAIDASNMPLRYEGLVNLEGLSQLEWLSLRGCSHVDDWFVDRVSHLFRDSLRRLDLSDCCRVTERALSSLYRFDRLDTLIVENIACSTEFKLSCLLLEQDLPRLNILGVDHVLLEQGKQS